MAVMSFGFGCETRSSRAERGHGRVCCSICVVGGLPDLPTYGTWDTARTSQGGIVEGEAFPLPVRLEDGGVVVSMPEIMLLSAISAIL